MLNIYWGSWKCSQNSNNNFIICLIAVDLYYFQYRKRLHNFIFILSFQIKLLACVYAKAMTKKKNQYMRAYVTDGIFYQLFISMLFFASLLLFFINIWLVCYTWHIVSFIEWGYWLYTGEIFFCYGSFKHTTSMDI